MVAIAAVMYLAFFASNIVLAGQSLHGIADPIPRRGGHRPRRARPGLIAVIGYKVIHGLNKIATWGPGHRHRPGTVAIFTSPACPPGSGPRAATARQASLATVSLGALWQIAFAPYVSDYSRYLPADVGVRDLQRDLPRLHPRLDPAVRLRRGRGARDEARREVMTGVRDTTGAFGTPLLVLFLLSVISHNALNLYGTVLDHHLRADLRRALDPTARSRPCSLVVMAASTYFAIGVSGDFTGHFVDIVLALLVVLVPWTAINLIDFYLIHHGSYDMGLIFAADGASTAASTARRSSPTSSASWSRSRSWPRPLYTGPIADNPTVPTSAGSSGRRDRAGLLPAGPRPEARPSELHPVVTPGLTTGSTRGQVASAACLRRAWRVAERTNACARAVSRTPPLPTPARSPGAPRGR